MLLDGRGSTINSNDLLAATHYPDPTTGAASSSNEETYTYRRPGPSLTSTDRNGNVTPTPTTCWAARPPTP